jgi:hypothetical protein
VWQLVDRLLAIGAARSAWEALRMPADMAVELLNARQYHVERDSAARGDGADGGVPDGQRRVNSDGSVSVRIGSMDSLRSLLNSKP